MIIYLFLKLKEYYRLAIQMVWVITYNSMYSWTLSSKGSRTYIVVKICDNPLRVPGSRERNSLRVPGSLERNPLEGSGFSGTELRTDTPNSDSDIEVMIEHTEQKKVNNCEKTDEIKKSCIWKIDVKRCGNRWKLKMSYINPMTRQEKFRQANFVFIISFLSLRSYGWSSWTWI